MEREDGWGSWYERVMHNVNYEDVLPTPDAAAPWFETAVVANWLEGDDDDTDEDETLQYMICMIEREVGEDSVDGIRPMLAENYYFIEFGYAIFET